MTLAAARAIDAEWWRTVTLAELVPNLPEAMRKQVLSEALAAARQIGDQQWRLEALAALDPRLPEELQGEGLEATREIRDKHWRPSAPAEEPQLPEPQLGDALAAALAIERGWERSRALADVAELLAALPPESLRLLWHATLPELAVRRRASLLSALAVLAPVLLALGGQEAITETRQAIQHVGRWWP